MRISSRMVPLGLMMVPLLLSLSVMGFASGGAGSGGTASSCPQSPMSPCWTKIQQGIGFVTVASLNLLGDSVFIPFSPVYSTTPNVTFTLVGTGIIGNSGSPVYSEHIPFLSSTGYTAPTLVVVNAETEIFGNTQDRRTVDLSLITSTSLTQGLFFVNVVTGLPGGDNGKMTLQYSLNAGGSWTDFVTCASAIPLTSTGIQVVTFTPSTAIAWAQATYLRVTVCNGNGVGAVTLGGIWAEFENQPFGSVFTTPQISAWNITTAGFNLEVLDSIAQAADITYQLNWWAGLPG